MNNPVRYGAVQFGIGLFLLYILANAFPRAGILIGILLLLGFLAVNPEASAGLQSLIEGIGKGIRGE